MNLLDRIEFSYQGQRRQIELYQGDLTEMGKEHAVDYLILSAFPNNYTPTHTSLIGALYRKGVSLEKLAQHKAEDLRQNFACWLSSEIGSSDPGIQFKRILCFEPAFEQNPPEVVGDIFQGLIPVLPLDGPPMRVAMSLLSTGNVNVPFADMLEPLVDAAIHWMRRGLRIQILKIVEINPSKALEMKGAFAILKRRYLRLGEERRYPYDLFISYSHQNVSAADFLIAELRKQRADLRIFLDRMELHTGEAWQQKIYESLDQCAQVVALFSPEYLSSKMCKEEFNIALFRQRESSQQILLPLYLYSAVLPTYMKLTQYRDCREADAAKLSQASQEIVQALEN